MKRLLHYAAGLFLLGFIALAAPELSTPQDLEPVELTATAQASQDLAVILYADAIQSDYTVETNLSPLFYVKTEQSDESRDFVNREAVKETSKKAPKPVNRYRKEKLSDTYFNSYRPLNDQTKRNAFNYSAGGLARIHI